MSHMGDVEF